MRAACAGVGLIEVLVALLVLTVGSLGMLALQSQAVQNTQAATLQGNAVMLAHDLLEMMRSNRDAVLDATGQLNGESKYFKAEKSAFPAIPDNCGTRQRGSGGDGVATADLGCWRGRIERLLPVTADLLTKEFAVCRSASGEACSDAGSLVMIRVAWADKRSKMCDGGVCSYVLRAEL
ncbi:type IV pilus modification protein PilV [Pseudomonas sp. UME83]|uniref:type IV pilus modification protein PilV n=1 Tax=Pseudomonas TaxID=286 RepID=UPI0002A37B2B|nr:MULTISPECIES: type IV pilus modification protein PilV [unclassified Pseudomonas]MBB1641111.1 type IV pilus modification protein PilV [Pseudomonas sp. UME83]NTX92969.1 type IV pilus modification protein PilV [Pseudomonas sp. UMA643]NTY21394.1 type IV pilus modification protein PilV [Pseudomonas sp. UMC3103]NTY27235.1 type IV pilus modification protein PilV [Pseudomonas sp. UMA603]NTY32885.1 type IV pilus modification protein PilV [Pseudomonas sp. UMC3129]